MSPAKTKVEARLGPCDAVPPCRDACPGWEPQVGGDAVWQPCVCGHSRHVHRLGLPLPPPELPQPEPPRICPCCGQPLPKEQNVDQTVLQPR